MKQAIQSRRQTIAKMFVAFAGAAAVVALQGFPMAAVAQGAKSVSTAQAKIDQRVLGAVMQDNGDLIASLAQKGADLNAPNDAGNPPLHIAIMEGSWKAAAALVAQRATDVNRANAKNETPLMLAALKGRLDLVKQLVEQREAYVNREGWAPLHYAASGNGADQVAIVKYLLDNYAFINARSPNETTPLMMAAGYGSVDVAKLLISEGAFVDAKNQQGMTAADFASKGNRVDLAETINQTLRAKFTGGKW